MKNYRSCLADAYALQNILEYLAGRADDMAGSVTSYLERAKENEEDGDGYYTKEAAEYEAKAAAFERLIVKLSK